MTDRTWNSLEQRWEYPETIAAIRAAVEALSEMAEEDRLEIFAHFCKHCGGDDPSCQCWNDE